MQTQRNVTVIPATRNVFTGVPTTAAVRRKVAAYARVSTDSDEQQTSYDAQVDYYTKYIQQKPEWEYAGTYTDEGISGTNTKKRNGFNRMIADALDGKIDLIITKSVSRFARNTVDSLTTIRKLKEKGVEVYFEKENIYTLDSKGELLLTLMSSLAQEESRSLSQNVTWGQRKRFSDGKVTMAYKSFLGYRKGSDGKPEIDPEEAKIVKRIYREYANGKSMHAIAKGLTADGIKTPRGKDVWRKSTVESILKNEKYKGDALLQKTFTADYLTKAMKVNEGEVPQYYVTGSHPAIIDPLEWDAVQLEMQRRANSNEFLTGDFLGRIICADCGSSYGSKVWHSNDKYRKVIWQCNNKFNGEKCRTPHLHEDDIKRMFEEAFSSFLKESDSLIADLRLLKDTCFNLEKQQARLNKLNTEMEITVAAIKQCISDNATNSISEDEYRSRYSSLYEKYEKQEAECRKLEDMLNESRVESDSISSIIECLENSDSVQTTFRPFLWKLVVEKVIVYQDGTVRFVMAGRREYVFKK